MDLNLDLNDIDFNNYGEWPAPVKGVVLVIIAIAVGYGWYHFHTTEQLASLDREQAREQELKQSFESKQQRAANLDAYRGQLVEMQESFGAMLKQLPDQTEVPALLVDVSQTGLASGLIFERFEPSPELTREFYAELPIRVRVTGYYHDFGQFIGGLAALPRIVTVHDIQIVATGSGRSARRSGAKGQDDNRLSLDATLKTYRYLDAGTTP